MGGKASRESKRAAHARQWYESSQAGAEATAGKTQRSASQGAAQKGHHTELSDLRNRPRETVPTWIRNDPINLNPGQDKRTKRTRERSHESTHEGTHQRK